MRNVEAKLVIIYLCTIPREYLIESTKYIPNDFIQVLNNQNGLPCGGGGISGQWCEGCHYFGGKKLE